MGHVGRDSWVIKCDPLLALLQIRKIYMRAKRSNSARVLSDRRKQREEEVK